MKAWVVERNGEPTDVLEWKDMPDLTPAAGQIKVAIKAAALNFPDLLLCRGKYQITPSLPFTPGMELAGEVVAVGPDVTEWKPGDRVLGVAWTAAGAGGAYAEYALMQIADVFRVPEGMPDHEAAGYWLTYGTAWLALHVRGAMKQDDIVLVHAGAGGVGSAAIQIAKAAGATVIATAGGPDKKQILTDLGADHAVDHYSEDFVQVVKAATGGRGAHVVVDPVGGDVYDKSTKCIAFEGRILVIGFTSGRIAQAATNHVLVKSYSVVGVNWDAYRTRRPEVIPQAEKALSALYVAGLIRPQVSHRYKMSELPAALAALASRRTIGKVVVVPE